MPAADSVLCGKWVSYFSKKYKAIALSPGKEVLIEDIRQFRTGRVPAGKTKVRIWQSSGMLNIVIFCFEPDSTQIRANVSEDGMGIWEDDLVEVFFGAIDPVPWQVQLAVGAGGGRFDSQGSYGSWHAHCMPMPIQKGWIVRIGIMLDMLPMQNLRMGFNICRQSVARQEFSTWAVLETAFHEVENYGELFFCDYQTAWLMKTGKEHKKSLNRRNFEKEVVELAIPSEQVAHGPFLSNPAQNTMTISWATAGLSAAMLEYKKEGTGKWEEFPVGRENGILRRNSRLHIAHLSGLEADTSYQYRLLNWSSLLHKRVFFPQQAPLTFRTLSAAPCAFSFAACSDIHSNVMMLKTLMQLPEVRETTFLVNLGDMLSRMSGPDAFYDGFLDLQSGVYAKEKPLVFVRGNHEQVGIFAADYLQMLPHPSGKTYYTFQHGAVFFLVLDAGDDKADEPGGLSCNSQLQEEQRLWLQLVAQSEAYQKASFRIALLHMPPYNDEYSSMASRSILSGIPESRPLDLLLCGHVHQYFRMLPFSGECRCFGKAPKVSMKKTPLLPFTVVGNDTNTLVQVEVTQENLQVRVLDCQGACIDQFEVIHPEK